MPGLGDVYCATDLQPGHHRVHPHRGPRDGDWHTLLGLHLGHGHHLHILLHCGKSGVRNANDLMMEIFKFLFTPVPTH